ncbi:MAG TPA: rhomboid family intramembrane serine protease [Geobacteraceae bacterium]|nr:rhomboid family intramembrane serine protease [Geobacteraceae bacterium]
MDIPEPGVVGNPVTAEQARIWALVLEARSIPCCIERVAAGWLLLVPAEHVAAAREELHLYEEENRDWPPPEPPARPLIENTLANLSVLVILATFHNITRLDTSIFGEPSPDWLAIGSAEAGKIMGGEWWRLVTALTLHLDGLHLFSNLAIGGVFIILLCREVGSGLSWTLLIGSGILGNLANAWLQPPEHTSIGASTVVFGAVGLLAALGLARHRRNRQRRWTLPVSASLALLSLLGTEGKNTDLGAHLFGFLFGIGLGLIAEKLLARYGRPGRRLNLLLALLSAAIVVAAWWEALVTGH